MFPISKLVTVAVTLPECTRLLLRQMKINWDGLNFEPLSAQSLQAALMISPARNDKRVAEHERSAWSFRCPDCSSTQVFNVGMSDSHDCSTHSGGRKNFGEA